VVVVVVVVVGISYSLLTLCVTSINSWKVPTLSLYLLAMLYTTECEVRTVLFYQQ